MTSGVRRRPARCWRFSSTRPFRSPCCLLAAGTVLGALWADKAWGRFWAWDPKEVWALISLLVYILVLHARYLGWTGDFGMIAAAILGATAVLFTWYGVNFLLGSGMHSYGSGPADNGRSRRQSPCNGCSCWPLVCDTCLRR